MLGSFELLRRDIRQQMGEMILDFLPRPRFEAIRPALLWALGRIGSRVPVYGPLNVVLSASVVEAWLPRVLELDVTEPAVQLAMMQMARRTNDRFRDLGDPSRSDVLRELDNGDAPTRFLGLVESGGELDNEEAGLVFGEALPSGLRLR